MKAALRVAGVLVAALATFCFVYWVPFSLILPSGRWIPLVGSLICGVAVVRYTWRHTASLSGGLAGSVIGGALVLGAIGFSCWYFGPAFSDEAEDLGRCIDRAAVRLRSTELDTIYVTCAVRDHRTVTAALDAGSHTATALRQLGLPNDAIFYSGLDSPSMGHRVAMDRVYVYDAAAGGNGKYQTTFLAHAIRIGSPKVATGTQFGVTLRRGGGGTVEVIALH